MFACTTGKLPLQIAVSDLEVGENLLQIVLTDANGATATYRATFQITPTGEYTVVSYYILASFTGHFKIFNVA